MLEALTMVRIAPVVFVCLWATGFVGARYSMPHAEPASFLSLRFAIAFAILGLVALLVKAEWPRGRALIDVIAVGALVHGIYLGGVFWAVRNGMPGGVSAVIVGLQPLLTAIMAALWINERVPMRQWLGIGLGLAGIAMVLVPKFDLNADGINVVTTIACLISVVAIAAGTVYQKRNVTHVDLRSGTALQYVGAFIPTSLFALMFESYAIDWNADSIFALLWLVFVLSIGAIFLLMWLIREGSVAQVSSLFFLVPAVAALMTWYLFGETLNLVQIAGIIVCAIAVAIASAKPKVAA